MTQGEPASLLLQQTQALALSQHYFQQQQQKQSQQQSSQQQQQQQQQQSPFSATTTTVTPPLSPFGGSGRSSGSGGKHMHSGGGSGKDRSRGINASNLKTELCRNYPNCKYGEKCAFAHSKSELRRLSLEEMQQAGRIPNANKYRVYPCLTWLSTGACPYNDRCVFVHDPRIKGTAKAWLYATPGSSAARHSAKSSPLYWPDLPAPADGTEALVTASIEYEVHPKNPTQPTYHEASVYCIWQAYRAVMQHGPTALGAGRALYGPGCDAPVRRLPVFEALSQKHARQVLKAGQGYDEEGAAMAQFALCFPPAQPGVSYLDPAAAVTTTTTTSSFSSSPTSHLVGGPSPLRSFSGASPTSSTTWPLASPAPTPPVTPATTAVSNSNNSSSSFSFFSAFPASPSSLQMQPPWGSEWRAAQQAITAVEANHATITTTKPDATTSPFLKLLAPATPTGRIWPPSRPSTAPPSPLLTPQAATAMAALAAAEAAAAGGSSSPSLSSVGSSGAGSSSSGLGSIAE